ncbi:uncharacterized protein [Drosophila pseudoobscura]|uniref:Salivary secreted peptide n=1 Tax=Drosophila pseudoobscura pseudoobscura TaxID=46245 RepID=A0A6I8VBI2_DROPS|nr:uncharacterized protein LOC26531942 [Drosophila pseudoobscura]
MIDLQTIIRLSLVVVALVVVVSPLLVHSKSVVFGQQSPNARLLYATHVAEPSKFFRITERRVTFKQDKNIKIIGAIVIENNNSTIGGEASLIEGGPTYTFATIKFKSKRNHGLNFNLYIYDSA